MRPATRTNLFHAQKLFGACARKLEKRRAPRKPLIDADRELQIGFGLCADWLRFAASIDGLVFVRRSERASSRVDSLLESTRFGYVWTATNALFSRIGILLLAKGGPLSNADAKSELHKFKVLYKFADVPQDVIDTEEKLLNRLLHMECGAEPLPNAPLKSHYKMYEVIFYKYIVPDQRRFKVAKLLEAAIRGGVDPILDAPTIIYAARNWYVHGVLISSSFRGTRQKHIVFTDSVTFLLSEVLVRCSIKLLPLL
jgi:hypothetical protein